ncbi:hypothetical protein LP420_28230 [Massilia sp. B-10]|nr:hypothetical protein LP420_28230 [Massilia sp. B-10]
MRWRCWLKHAAGLAAQSPVPATEAQWIAAASAAVAFGQARGMPIALEVQGGDGLSGHTPVGIWSENGRCTLVVSARDNPTADRVSAMVDPAVLALFLAAPRCMKSGIATAACKAIPTMKSCCPWWPGWRRCGAGSRAAS